MNKVIESHLNSIIKSLSWRTISSLITVIICYLITKKLTYAFAIGSTEVTLKIMLFYFHERMWVYLQNKIDLVKDRARYQQT